MTAAFLRFRVQLYLAKLAWMTFKRNARAWLGFPRPWTENERLALEYRLRELREAAGETDG